MMNNDPSRQLMSFAGLPQGALSSSLGLLQLQHQMAQQQSTGSVLQRAGLPGPYSTPSHFQRPMFPANSTVPNLSGTHSSWSPYFLFARGPQPFMTSLPDTHAPNGLPIMSRGMMGNIGGSPGGFSGPPKDNILSSSIESLRIRARQHSASMGYYE